MRLVCTEHALRDLDDILDFYETVDVRAAIELCQGAMTAAEQLADFPEMGRVLDDASGPSPYRSLVHRTLRIIYRVETGRVLLLRVWDNRRDPNRLEIIDG